MLINLLAALFIMATMQKKEYNVKRKGEAEESNRAVCQVFNIRAFFVNMRVFLADFLLAVQLLGYLSELPRP